MIVAPWTNVVGSGVDAIVLLAAESHVDRSILGASECVRTNVLGTPILLDAARDRGVGKFVHVSTDEVYGSLSPDGRFTEERPLAPNSPYAASKAAADLLVQAYIKTYGLPAIITCASNNYGPYQFPEKVIPLFITNALEGREPPVHGDGQHVREWLLVEDHCEALERIMCAGQLGEVYNTLHPTLPEGAVIYAVGLPPGNGTAPILTHGIGSALRNVYGNSRLEVWYTFDQRIGELLDGAADSPPVPDRYVFRYRRGRVEDLSGRYRALAERFNPRQWIRN